MSHWMWWLDVVRCFVHRWRESFGDLASCAFNCFLCSVKNSAMHKNKFKLNNFFFKMRASSMASLKIIIFQTTEIFHQMSVNVCFGFSSQKSNPAKIFFTFMLWKTFTIKRCVMLYFLDTITFFHNQVFMHIISVIMRRLILNSTRNSNKLLPRKWDWWLKMIFNCSTYA